MTGITAEKSKWRSQFDPTGRTLGDVPASDGAGGIAWSPPGGGGASGLPAGYLTGYITAPNSVTPLTILDFGAGAARSSDNTADIILASVLTKQINANWVAGDGVGGFPSGLTLSANTWYHLFVISNGSTVDAGFDTSLTAANLLADAVGYTTYRRVGSILANASSQITDYVQRGNDFRWVTEVNDYSAFAPTVATAVSLSVPNGISVRANAIFRAAAPGTASYRAFAIGGADPVPTIPNASLVTTVTSQYSQVELNIFTNASRQINHRSTSAGHSINIITRGWTDPRADFSTGIGGGAAAPGAWELLETRAITAVSQIDMTWDETAYKEIKFVIEDLQVDTDSVQLFARAGSGNGTTIYSASATYRGVYNGLTGTWPNMAGGTTQWALCYSSLGNAANEYLNGELRVMAFASANTGCLFESKVQFNVTTGALTYVRTHGDFYGTAIAIDTIRFYPEVGSFVAGGTIRMYGLKA